MAAIFLRSQLLSFPDCAFESGVLWRMDCAVFRNEVNPSIKY
ncbi:hypothetical protein KIS1582_0721 [Cytobacillus firmus]|uniref:Uncharacterized protein n=1 Tax=Cytobacillus firmus TaxID=1399 RepID=A0A800NEQ9_CYTFI|nr:hypothetical protein [Cytobacillus firmus]KAF0825414.1 hypothetical protein KIS1582_0721 [Cytobacillus firmus]